MNSDEEEHPEKRVIERWSIQDTVKDALPFSRLAKSSVFHSNRSLTFGRKPKRFLVLDGGHDIREREEVLGMPTKEDRRSAVTYSQVEAGAQPAKPVLHQKGHEIQPYGKIVKVPIALDEKVCAASAEYLNQVLADTITLRDLYKKHHWQVAGHTFYELHLLFDKHYNEQNELVDAIAERIQTLGAVSLAMAADVSETTIIPRPPRGREEVPVQISRLLEAHEIVLKEVRTIAREAAEAGDDGTNDLLVSDVIRTNESQVWFLAEHAVDVPLVRVDQGRAASLGS